MSPNLRAFGVTALFAVLGCGALFFHNPPWDIAIPNAVFYAVLTLNTFFSVRFYSRFTPVSLFQTLIDGALVVTYGALALSIGVPLAFSFCALLVFVIAPLKYVHMLGTTPYDATLRRKIRIDLLGTALCALVFMLTYMHFTAEAAWLLAGLFSAANIYLLVISPMYRHVEVV